MKKFIALILSLIFVFAIAFTACDDNTDNGQGGTNNEQIGSTQSGDGNGDEDGKKNNDNEDNNDSNSNGVDIEVIEGYEIGRKLPDFTVETFNSAYTEEIFSSEDARGKVLVINFWYTTCGICVDEMQDIEKVNNKYGDDVVVIALHLNYGSYVSEALGVQRFMDKKGWSNYNVIFGKDLAIGSVFKNCGGTACPYTVVLNGDGIVSDILQGNMFPGILGTFDHEDYLTPAIEAALNK